MSRKCHKSTCSQFRCRGSEGRSAASRRWAAALVVIEFPSEAIAAPAIEERNKLRSIKFEAELEEKRPRQSNQIYCKERKRPARGTSTTYAPMGVITRLRLFASPRGPNRGSENALRRALEGILLGCGSFRSDKLLRSASDKGCTSKFVDQQSPRALFGALPSHKLSL